MTSKNEKELWLSFLEGDISAFSDLYRTCYRRLYSYARSYNMPHGVADDAIQDLFIRLYNKKSLVKNPDTILPMMYSSLRNYYYNTLKKAGKHIGIDETDPAFNFSYTLDEKLTENEDKDALKRRIDALIDQLTPRQKEIVYLRYFVGMDYDNISLAMNLPKQVARNLLSKAITRMRSRDPSMLKLLLTIGLPI